MNYLIFNFLNFQENVHQFMVETAVAAVESRKSQLPQMMLEKIETERTDDLKKTMQKNFQVRRKKFGMMRDEDIENFARLIEQMDDDRDAVALVEQFTKEGSLPFMRTSAPTSARECVLETGGSRVSFVAVG